MLTEPDSRLVYAKTPAGTAEITERRHGLSQPARRILILVDGQRRLGDLFAFSRAGELVELIGQLEALGLVALAGIADTLTQDELRERAQQEQAAIAQVKQELDGAFEKELGEAGQVLDARIADSVNLDVIRTILRDAIDTVHSRKGERAAQALAERLRPLLARAQ